MKPRIIVIGDSTHVRSMEVALLAARIEATVEVVGYVPSCPVEMMVSSANYDLSNAVKQMAFDYGEEAFDDTDAILAGIRELRLWMENKIRSVINVVYPSRRQHRAPLFQPCWSARRWKSLT